MLSFTGVCLFRYKRNVTVLLPSILFLQPSSTCVSVDGNVVDDVDGGDGAGCCHLLEWVYSGAKLTLL